MKKFYISLLALISAMTLAANATNTEANETAIDFEWIESETDSVAIDENSIEDTEEEVEPQFIIIGEDTFPAPPKPVHLDMSVSRKATMAGVCRTDSIIGLDTIGNYVSKEEYKYDAAGHTIEYAKYSWTNGIKKGESHYRKYYTGNTATTVVYFKWDATLVDWIGKDSTIYLYDGATNTGRNIYVWDKSTWRLNEQYEYYYESNVQIGNMYSKYNADKQKVIPVYKYVFEHDAKGHEIENQRWSYSNDIWIGYSRTEQAYDENNNQILKAEYSGWENSNWKGKANGKTTWEYNANKKVIRETKFTWSNGWVNSTKTEKDYEGSNVKDIASYKWNNGDWIGSGTRTLTTWTSGKKTEEIKMTWDSANKTWKNNTKTEYSTPSSNVSVEAQYSWGSVEGVMTWIGSKKVETTSQSGKITNQVEYTWAFDDWFKVKEQINNYEGSLIKSELTKEWNGTEVANKSRTLYEYGYKNLNTLKVSQEWKDSEWKAKDSTKHEIKYIYIQKVEREFTESDIQMKWTNSDLKWNGSKVEYTYDDAGNQLQSLSSEYSDGWVYKTRNRTEYKDMNASLKTLQVSETWNGTAWVGSYKYEYGFDETNRPVISARYSWNGSNWIGENKSEEVWVNNKKIKSIIYKWDYKKSDWIGDYKDEYQYDQKGHQIEYTQYSYDGTNWIPTEQKLDEYDDVHSTPIITENNVWKNGDWCSVSSSETNYDEKVYGGRERFKLDIDYENCTKITKYDYKRYYYSCDNYYDIQYVNYDNSLLKAFHTLEGETPYYNLKVYGTPQKPDDKQYTYTFKSWDQPVTVATGDKVYTATFTATPRKFTVTFYNEDKTQVIEERSWDYGSTPTCAEPTKSNTAQYTFKFKGWSDGIVSVDGDTSYVAMFDTIVNRYAIDYFNGETKILRDSVEYGKKPVYSGETPTKDATAQYTYTFSGWDNELATVTGDAAYHAQFSQTTNKYAVIFYDENGTTELQNSEWEYGSVPTYSGTTPTKTGDAQYSYTFDGWDKEVIMVTAEASYKAKYAQSVNKYLVTFYDEDGTTELQSKEWEYGATPEYTGTTPTKDATAQYTYTFTGWTPTIESVTQVAGYSATFSSIINNYTVTFEVKGNSLLSQSVPNVPYGTKVLTLVEQVKTALGGDSFEDDSYIYSFAGIEGPDKVVDENAIIEADETFYVLYSKTPKTPTGVDQMVNGKSSNGKLLIDGILYIQRDGKLYTIQGNEVENK